MKTAPENEINGSASHSFKCPLEHQWEPTKERFEEQMGIVTTKLGDIATAIQDSNKALIGPATGRKQVPLEVVLSLILFWAVFSVIDNVKNTKKDIKLNWHDGLSITEVGKER